MFLKFPIVSLPSIMKDKILNKAADMFLTLGFKSVTMDEIATALGVSKKTIYTHFGNKTELVEEATLSTFQFISEQVGNICNLEKNPIEEIYDIKRFIVEKLKNEKSSPQYQLQKYYPKIFNTLKKKKFELMHDCVTDNLNRGIRLELYRDTINVEFIVRMYIVGTNTLKDLDVFPLEQFTQKILMDNYLEYHLRGICTEKGIEELIKQQQKK